MVMFLICGKWQHGSMWDSAFQCVFSHKAHLVFVCCVLMFKQGFLGKESVCQCRMCKRHRCDPLEKEIATHSSILPWKIPWMEEPGGLQSMGTQRIRPNYVDTHTVFKQGTFVLFTNQNSHRRKIYFVSFIWGVTLKPVEFLFTPKENWKLSKIRKQQLGISIAHFNLFSKLWVFQERKIIFSRTLCSVFCVCCYTCFSYSS